MAIRNFILFIAVFGISHNLHSDIIPENHHFVNKCSKITNIEDFSNVTLLGYVKFLGSQHENTYEITSNSCLTKGYKFNSLTIFAVCSSYINGKNFSEIDFSNDENALVANIDIDPWGGYYPDSNPIVGIEEFYKIMGFSKTSVVLFKWKEIISYNNGAANSVNTYKFVGDISKLSPQIPTGINRQVEHLDISVINNPNYLLVNVDNNYFGRILIDIITVDGKKVSTYQVTKNDEIFSCTIPSKNIKPDLYIIKFSFGDLVLTRRVLIEK